MESMICNYQKPMQKTNDTASSDADNDVASKGKKLFLHNKPLLVVSIFSIFLGVGWKDQFLCKDTKTDLFSKLASCR